MSEEDPKSWVYAGGLPYELTEGDVVCVFSQYGEVFEISLARDKDTGKSRGFCFIKYEDPRSCELAVDNLDGAAIVGRKIRVSYPSNLNFVNTRRPAIVAPTENASLPKVEFEKTDRKDDYHSDERLMIKDKKHNDEEREKPIKKDHHRGEEDRERRRRTNSRHDEDRQKRKKNDHHGDTRKELKRRDHYDEGREERRTKEYRYEEREKLKRKDHHDEDRDRRKRRDHHDKDGEKRERHHGREQIKKSSRHR